MCSLLRGGKSVLNEFPRLDRELLLDLVDLGDDVDPLGPLNQGCMLLKALC